MPLLAVAYSEERLLWFALRPRIAVNMTAAPKRHHSGRKIASAPFRFFTRYPAASVHRAYHIPSTPYRELHRDGPRRIGKCIGRTREERAGTEARRRPIGEVSADDREFPTSIRRANRQRGIELDVAGLFKQRIGGRRDKIFARKIGERAKSQFGICERNSRRRPKTSRPFGCERAALAGHVLYARGPAWCRKLLCYGAAGIGIRAIPCIEIGSVKVKAKRWADTV